MLLRNTLLYNILFIVLNIVIPVTLAVLINQIYSRIASKAYQTMMFFPHFLSWVVVSYFVYAFLNPDKGLMNTIIQALGGDKIMWYSQPKWWPLILTFMQVWKSMGYNMVVYLASITGIDSTLYEAANAGRRDQVAADQIYYTAGTETHHRYDVHSECRPHLLFRFRLVLSGYAGCSQLTVQRCQHI